MTIVKCDAPDCLNIDRKTMICTLDDAKIVRGLCKSYKQDIKYLRGTWKYMTVPIYDDYAQGSTPVVRLDEDESVRK